jgi:hypothetical protein
MNRNKRIPVRLPREQFEAIESALSPDQRFTDLDQPFPNLCWPCCPFLLLSEESQPERSVA